MTRRRAFAWLVLALPLALAGAAEEDPAGGGEAPPAVEGPSIEVRDGHLVNFVHRYYLPLGEAWRLEEGADAEFQVLRHAGQPGVTLWILVSPGSEISQDEAVGALRRKVAEDPRSHVLAQTRRRIGIRSATDLLALREGRSRIDGVTMLRTVTFARAGNRYYLRLEAPAAVYEPASADFEEAVEGFGLESRFRFPWQKEDR